MMFFNRSRQSGFTVLELMLAIAVAGVIVMFGVNRYRSYIFQHNVTAIKSSVETLMNGMANYYYENCMTNSNFVNGNTFSITIGSLSATIPNSKQINNPLNPRAGINSFTMTYVPLTKAQVPYIQWYHQGFNTLESLDWVMRITMSLDSSYNSTYKNDREAYRTAVGAKADTSSVFTWEQSVQAYSKENLAGLSPLHANLRQFSTETYVSPSTTKRRPAETRTKQLQTPCGLSDFRVSY